MLMMRLYKGFSTNLRFNFVVFRVPTASTPEAVFLCLVFRIPNFLSYRERVPSAKDIPIANPFSIKKILI